ncbi:MAG: hypothetical protein JW929_12315 [Anaerolineales bacterium]|nr:hypothetical protein [Anaerolineales bacterium]
MKLNPKILILAGAALACTLALAASQGAASGGDPWWYAEVFWPNFLVFLIPMLLAFGLIEVATRYWLPGGGGEFARRCTWGAFAARLAFLIVAPILMLMWGYESNRNLKGLVQLDAINATDTAWHAAASGGSVLEAWGRGPGDNTGGITVLGVALFRMLSPDLERTLLLGLVACAVTSLTVIAVYRLASGLFSPRVAGAAALAAAVFPEAVMIGASHQQMGYITLIFSTALLAIAGLIRSRGPVSEAGGLPERKAAAVLLVLSAVLGFVVSQQFAVLGVICGAVFAIWLSDPRRRIGRILWIGAGVVIAVLIVLRVLAAADIISSDWDYLFGQYRYLYGMAWSEFEKMVDAGGGDFFQTVLAGMEKGPAFALAGIYGLVRPALPAAIGYRNPAAQGGFFWQLLNLYRSLGWYLILPVLLYGTLKAVRGILKRNPEFILAALFWFVALVGSYRAFGDEWDNPRYRLFALAPMALLSAWAWTAQRESRDPWFLRIVIPFATATAALTVWYILRDYANLDFPAVPSILVIGAITAAAFVVSLFVVRPKKTGPSG